MTATLLSQVPLVGLMFLLILIILVFGASAYTDPRMRRQATPKATPPLGHSRPTSRTSPARQPSSISSAPSDNNLTSEPVQPEAEPQLAASKSRTAAARNVTESTIRGRKLGKHLQRLIAKARAGGWSAIGSVQIRCVDCSEAVHLKVGTRVDTSKMCLVMSGGRIRELNDPLTCENCNSSTFAVNVCPTTFKEVFRHAVDALPPCEQDPAEGFRSVETGRLIRDFGFRAFSDFEQLWSYISPWMDARWGFNANYAFENFPDTNGRLQYIERVPAVLYWNQDQNCYVCVFKDSTGHYWCNYEKRTA